MWLFDKLTKRGDVGGIWDDVQISPVVARSIQDCMNVFYFVPSWAKKANMKLSGLPVILTNYLATLCTTELEINCGAGARADWIKEQMQPLMQNMQRAVQLAAAGGEVIIRPYLSGKDIAFDLVQAGRFFPTRFGANGRAEAGFFCDYHDSKKGGSYVRIESFDWRDGVLSITNKAYRNQGDVLSKEVPLSSVEEWAELTPKFTIENVSGPLFGVLRMPFPNTVDDTSDVPISLYANALSSLKEFDETYSEFLFELHSGKRKRIVERNAIRPKASSDKSPGGVPVGITYRDTTTDTYIVIDPTEEHKPFDDYTPQLRVDEYVKALKTIMAVVENQCYITPGTVSIDDRTGAVTATQIISEDRTTYNTCNAVQKQGIEPALIDVMRAIDVLAELYELAPAGEIEPSVTFGDSVFEDTAQEFVRRMSMVQAGVLRSEELLQWYFGVDEDSAKKMMPEQTKDDDPWGLNSDGTV